jgi:hypothetical protein
MLAARKFKSAAGTGLPGSPAISELAALHNYCCRHRLGSVATPATAVNQRDHDRPEHHCEEDEEYEFDTHETEYITASKVTGRIIALSWIIYGPGGKACFEA